MEINPEVIRDQPKSRFARHWVVVNENAMPKFDGKTLETFVKAAKKDARVEKIDMQLACWGTRNNVVKADITVDTFLDDWFGVAAFPRIP